MNSLPQKKQTVFSKKLLISFGLQGILVAAVSIVAYAIGLSAGSAVATTMAFITLTLSQVLFTLSARTENLPSFLTIGENKISIYSCIGALLLILLVTVTPLRSMFGLELLMFGNWIDATLLSLIPMLIAEGVKLVKYLTKKA